MGSLTVTLVIVTVSPFTPPLLTNIPPPTAKLSVFEIVVVPLYFAPTTATPNGAGVIDAVLTFGILEEPGST